MNFNKKLLDKIDNLVKLSKEFDDGFRIIFDLETTQINEQNVEILYSMTTNYISMRKEHGELLLMMNEHMNSINSDEKTKKSLNTNILYDISTFNTLMNNLNDLINNIDYEYKKIALKYPKFIHKSQITVILICSTDADKYIKMIEELKMKYPEHKYKIINCNDTKSNITKCEEELKEYGIKIKSLKTLPLIYILNKSTLTEIPISKIENIEPIEQLIK